MRYALTSDVHLGSRYCCVDAFKQFVKRLQPDITLVLAGDVLDDPQRPLSESHQAALDLIWERATTCQVVWVSGNHDDGYAPKPLPLLKVATNYQIDRRLFIAHGDRFDNVMPYNRWFIRSFKFLHNLRLKLGAHPVHVAHYAKRFGMLYRFLRRNVQRNAIEHAREVGVEAVACGHVHYAEDVVDDGIRYINLGAWCELPNYVLLIDDDGMRLEIVEEVMDDDEWFTGEE